MKLKILTLVILVWAQAVFSASTWFFLPVNSSGQVGPAATNLLRTNLFSGTNILIEFGTNGEATINNTFLGGMSTLASNFFNMGISNILAADGIALATNGGVLWITNISSSGGITTNATQFAPSVQLTIKPDAYVTNIHNFGNLTNTGGDFWLDGSLNLSGNILGFSGPPMSIGFGDGTILDYGNLDVYPADARMTLGSNTAFSKIYSTNFIGNGAGLTNLSPTPIYTNGVLLGYIFTNIDYVSGVTGYVSGSSIRLGISTSGDAGGTNSRQFGSLNLTNWSLLPTGSMANVVSTDFLTNWTGSISNLTQTKQNGSAVLTNLVGTVANNVTNVVSLSTTNATSKPLTNAYASGVLTLFGLEAGSGQLLSMSSNIVVGADWAQIASTTNVVGVSNWVNAVSNYVTAATNSASVTNWINSRQPANAVLSNLVGLADNSYTNVPKGGTNISVRTAGGTNFIDTIGNLNDWGQIPTGAMANVVSANFLTNWAGSISNLAQTKQNGNINLTNISTLPPAPMYGATIRTDGTNALWTVDANGSWIVNEEWNGDVTSTTTGAMGQNSWQVGTTGTLPTLVGPIIDTVNIACNYLSCVTTQSASARAWYLGVSGTPGTLVSTNLELFFIARTRIGQTNITGDVTTHRVGLGDTSGAGEWPNGIYITVNTNVNTNSYVFSTSRGGTRTTTYSSHAANTNDAMSMTWMVTGFYLDRTGTNVIFYVGPSETNLTAVATNTLNIPAGNKLVGPMFQVNRIASSAGTVFRTNYCDWIKVWARKI